MSPSLIDVAALSDTSDEMAIDHKIDPKARPSLIRLPLELLIALCSGLPLDSTTSLSNTCAALHPIASAFAWVHLNLTRQSAQCDVSGWPAPLGGQRFCRIETTRIFDDEAGSPIARKLMAGLVIEVQRRLEARHERKGAVRKFSFDDNEILSNAHSELLKLIAPSLTELIVFSADMDPPPPITYSLEQVISTTQLASLRRLHLPLPEEEWWIRIGLLVNAPRLRTVSIVPSIPWSGGWGSTITNYNPPPPSVVWPSLPLLCELEIGEVELVFLPFVTSLVRTAPRLRRVTLGDPVWKWAPNEKDELLVALSKLPHLDCLAISANVRDIIGEMEGFDSLRTVSVVERARPWSSSSEQLESMKIPVLPTVRHFVSQLYLSENDPWPAGSYHGEHMCLPAPVQHLPDAVVRQLLMAASVETILFTGWLRPEGVQDVPNKDAAHWGSPESYENSDHVFLVRTYCNEEGKVFTHCRRFTAHHTRMCDDIICRHEDVWEEFTDFDGVHVPAGLLGQVFAVCGMPVTWTQPGRGLKMPREAWDVLNRWWMRAGWIEWVNLRRLFGDEDSE